MRMIIFSIAFLLCSVYMTRAFEDTTLEDDDFAEFEQFEADEDEQTSDGGITFNMLAVGSSFLDLVAYNKFIYNKE